MKEIIRFLNEHDSFLLISHISPDGDTLGSAAALALALRDMGKQVTLAVDGTVSHRLRIFEEFVHFYNFDTKPEEEYDGIVSLDCGDLGSLGKFERLFSAHECTAVIDHHPTNPAYGKINWIKPVAATTMMVLEILLEMQCEITKPIANCLYVGLSTDTGNFCFSNVDGGVFETARVLADAGAEIVRICDMLYEQNTLGATRIQGRAIDSLEMLMEGRIAIVTIELDDIDAAGAVVQDCSGIVDIPRRIEGAELAIFFRQTTGGKYKVSMRSHNYVDCAAIAAKFGGGGHVRAAGATMQGSMDEIRAAVIPAACAAVEAGV